jgi:hypothetical protein
MPGLSPGNVATKIHGIKASSPAVFMRGNAMPDDIRNLWQNQELEAVAITLQEIRRRADRFQRPVQARNLREYTAGILLIAVETAVLWTGHRWHRVQPIS